jgi:hypothetical protein
MSNGWRWKVDRGAGQDCLASWRDRAYVPTLEALIEASGYPFDLNSNRAGYWYARNAQHSERQRAEGHS